TKASHLQDAVAGLALKLTDAEVASLEADYIAHAEIGIRV
ncbi:MAG: hypothetical protein RL300_1424, partial [Pseudomonadota bacterium]